MIGLDVTHKALFTPAHAERLRASGRVGTWSRSCSTSTREFHLRVYGIDGSPIHDAVAVAHVLDPSSSRRSTCNVDDRRRVASSAAAGRSSTSGGRTAASRTRTSASTSTPTRFLELLVERLELARVSLVFAAIAPHGTLARRPVEDADATHAALEELGRRFDAARPEATIVLTPHNVHVEGHFAVVARGQRSRDARRSSTHRTSQLACPVDLELAAQTVVALRDDGVPVVGVELRRERRADAATADRLGRR